MIPLVWLTLGELLRYNDFFLVVQLPASFCISFNFPGFSSLVSFQLHQDLLQSPFDAPHILRTSLIIIYTFAESTSRYMPFVCVSVPISLTSQVFLVFELIYGFVHFQFNSFSSMLNFISEMSFLLFILDSLVARSLFHSSFDLLRVS